MGYRPCSCTPAPPCCSRSSECRRCSRSRGRRARDGWRLVRGVRTGGVRRGRRAGLSVAVEGGAETVRAQAALSRPWLQRVLRRRWQLRWRRRRRLLASLQDSLTGEDARVPAGRFGSRIGVRRKVVRARVGASWVAFAAVVIFLCAGGCGIQIERSDEEPTSPKKERVLEARIGI